MATPFYSGYLEGNFPNWGKQILMQQVKTAGLPAELVVTADRPSIKADGNDLSFLTVKVTTN